jgi:uncharacterized protein (DUF2141 family)
MRLIVLLGLLLLLSASVAAAGVSGVTGLSVVARGFEDDSGQCVVFLYREADKLPSSPFLTASAPISGRRAEIDLPSLPEGGYAAILLHDRNRNGRIDHAFGIPREPLGYSNGWRLGWRSGMPSFWKLRFVVSDSARILEIPITFRKR